MEDEEVIGQLSAIIAKLFRKKDVVVTSRTVASDVDGWDSLSHALLMLRVEKAFGVKFDDADVARMQSVGELVEAIKLAGDR